MENARKIDLDKALRVRLPSWYSYQVWSIAGAAKLRPAQVISALVWIALGRPLAEPDGADRVEAVLANRYRRRAGG